MADKHSLFEAFPRQRFRGGQTAHTDKVPFFIYQSRFAIQHIRQFASCQCMYHLLQRIILMKTVAGIEETKVIARSQPDTFVHGVVQAFIGFAYYLCDVILVAVCDRKRFVFRGPVHNDILHMAVSLRDNALDSVFQYRFGIVGYGNDAELGGEMIMHFFR